MSDTVSALTKALAPKTGMQRLPFPVESYEHPSQPISQKRLLNYFVEAEPSDSRTAAALIPTPGLVQVTSYTFGAGPVYAMNNDMPGITYAISGNHAYRAGRPYGSPVVVVEDLGVVGLAGGSDYSLNLMPTIAVGVTAAVFVVPPNAYTCPHYGPMHQIGGDFPGARSVAYLDGYFIFTSDDIDSNFFVSGLLDPTAYDALDFAYADGIPNIIRLVLVVRGDAWFLGDNGTEAWYDSGDADFPLRRRSGSIVNHGLSTVHSACVGDGSIFWLTTEGVVVRTNGYQAVRISTHAIEYLIKALGGAVAVKRAIYYAQGGHAFYCLTVNTRTLCYDCVTQKWSERSSASNGDGPWLPSAAAQAGDLILLGSSTSGLSFTPTPGVDLDDGVQLYRQIVLPPLWAGTHRAFMNRVEIELEVGGSNPADSLLLECSDDGGRSWKQGRVLAVGPTGATTTRVLTNRLGSFHQRMLRLTLNGGYSALYAVDADIAAPLMGG